LTIVGSSRPPAAFDQVQEIKGGQRTLVLCAQQDCEGILIWLLIWQMGRIFGDTGSLGETGCKQKRSGDVE